MKTKTQTKTPTAGSLQPVVRRPWTHKQETEEMLRPPPFEREDYCGGCGMLRSQCDCWDSVNQS